MVQSDLPDELDSQLIRVGYKLFDQATRVNFLQHFGPGIFTLQGQQYRVDVIFFSLLVYSSLCMTAAYACQQPDVWRSEHVPAMRSKMSVDYAIPPYFWSGPCMISTI